MLRYCDPNSVLEACVISNNRSIISAFSLTIVQTWKNDGKSEQYSYNLLFFFSLLTFSSVFLLFYYYFTKNLSNNSEIHSLDLSSMIQLLNKEIKHLINLSSLVLLNNKTIINGGIQQQLTNLTSLNLGITTIAI